MYQVINAKLLQLQNSIGKIRPKNFGVCLLNQLLLESGLGVQTEALSRSRTSSTTSSLLRRGFGNRRNEQRLNSDTWIVDLLFTETGVNNVHNTVNSQRSFCNIRSYDDLTSWSSARSGRWRCWLENPLLLGWRQSTIERIDLQWSCISFSDHFVCLK